MNTKNIVIIPGLGCTIDIWKKTKTNQISIYHYLKNHTIIDLTLSIDKFKLDIDSLMKYIHHFIPDNSYILSNSFGCIISILYTYRYPHKIKGILMIDPTTKNEQYRFKRIKDSYIADNLKILLYNSLDIKYLKCPIIIHTNIPFKKFTNPYKKISNYSIFNMLNDKFKYLKLLSNNPKSNIIMHPNSEHFIKQTECEKIKCSIDYLIN